MLSQNVNYFLDYDIYRLDINKLLKKLSKLVNNDMKYLDNGFNANMILIINEKSELVIRKSLRKMLSEEIKIKIEKSIHQTRVKYIGVKKCPFQTLIY